MGKLMQLKNKQFLLTIPRNIADAKGWKKGTDLKFKINDLGDVSIKEIEN